ncbi:MAG: hypothetical protein HXO74_04935 [Scardovia wiggsiae]|nr:hypothetical protein [Scardovia wiggsiae]
MVSRGGGSSFLDDRVTRLWYVRRTVALMVLFAIILGMAGYAVYGYCQRREQEYVYFIRSMSSYYREDMGEGRGGMYGEVVKPVSDDFVKNRDAGAWFGDPVKPGKEGELRHVMDIYNGLYPEKKTNVGEFRRYYGSDWQKHVKESFAGQSNVPQFAHWCYQKADLVYKKDYGSIERSFHKAGSAVKDPPSNYSYYTGADGRYDYFELRSMFEAGR